MMSHCTQYILSDHGETMGVERRQRPEQALGGTGEETSGRVRRC